MKVYYWDTIEYDIEEREVTLPPGLTPRQTMVLCEDHILQLVRQERTSKVGMKVRGKVFVLTGKDTQNFKFHVYACPSDDEKARVMANKDRG